MSQQNMRVRNAADRDQVRKAERDVKHGEKRYMLALRNIMNTQDGRIVFKRLLEAAGIGVAARNDTAFHASGSVTSYNLGQRDYGSDLQEALKRASLKLYHLMETESRDDAEDEALEVETDREQSQENDNG